jgi:hypothetical protein
LQKRKRREYRLNRTAAFTRPDPGFSLYEGRTRGKRLRYTFSDEEDFDSDNLGARRSTRTSGKDTLAVPSGPTVTASGRQVRSRATGLYGETLHSGQVSDHASPATGDYERSDASEEPRTQGRSTRAGNRGATNGRSSHRTVLSDDEEDATSWDGGDEDEEEPEQMDVDDDEDDQDEESSEEEEEPQTLMVTLRYGTGSATGPTRGTGAAPDVTQANGFNVNGAASAGALESSDQIPAPIEPTPHPAPPSHPLADNPSTKVASNLEELRIHSSPQFPPAVPAVQHTQSVDEPAMLPRLDGMISAPAQPYSEAQEPHGQAAQQQQPYKQLPTPAPASTWQ